MDSSKQRKDVLTPTLSVDSRKSRLARVQRYHAQLKESDRGMTYLKQRGLTGETIRRFGLGIVDDPDVGDESYKGRLVIPYMTHCPIRGWSAMTTRFRLLAGEGKKYLSYPGDSARLYNPAAIDAAGDYLAICEGEMDAISAEQAGIPAVALPGAEQWKPWYAPLFDGIPRIFVLADDDEAGRKYASTIAKCMEVTPIPMIGGDVNSVLVEHGEERLKEMIGINEGS